MEIKTKFNVGDVVYVCNRNKIHKNERCNICDGKGTITIKDNDFICPRCNGNKYIRTRGASNFVPEEKTITKIIVSISKNHGNTQTHTRYGFDDSRKCSVADCRNLVFTTKEEAETRCKELYDEELEELKNVKYQ